MSDKNTRIATAQREQGADTGADQTRSAINAVQHDDELILVEIEVVPLKRRNLANAKTEALSDLDHRAPRLL